MENLRIMDYKYSFTDDTTCVLVPQKLQCSIGNTRMLNKLTKVSRHISTVNIITNFWSQQHTLFLESIIIYAVRINLQPHDHWKSPYKDISLRHHKNGGRIWDCLSYSGSTNSPAGKTPHQYSEDHQKKWVQSLAHIVHYDMHRDLWILVLEFRIIIIIHFLAKWWTSAAGSCIKKDLQSIQ